MSLHKYIKYGKHGKGITDMYKNLDEEMHLSHPTGENVPGGSFNNSGTYSYCGPETHVFQRIKEGYKGVNALDRACMYHDLFYSAYKDTKRRNLSDLALAEACNKFIADPNSDQLLKTDAQFIKTVMIPKALLQL